MNGNGEHPSRADKEHVTVEETSLSRRGFLQGIGAGTLLGITGPALRLPSGSSSAASGPVAPEVVRLTERLAVYGGPIHVGLVRDGSKALLIDCGDGGVTEEMDRLGVSSIDRILFTHHHRDQACGVHRLAAQGTRIGVPAAERDAFEKVDAYWSNPSHRWHIYSFHSHALMLTDPVRVDFTVKDGEVLNWGPARIRVIATPGHTDGSVSYLVEVDGKKVVFSGDVIYDEGRVWDIHSLQKGFSRGGQRIGDYHGFLGARPELDASLKRLRDTEADALVPSHGRIITDPPKAIETLLRRLEEGYDQYVAISALRHYFPRLFDEYAGHKDHMPFGRSKPAPSCLAHYGTTWVVISQDKAAFVMDCGSPRVVETLKRLIDQGQLRTVEGLWVTHYHDDHVDAIPAFQKAFDCPCITDRAVAQVITDPPAWRLPCISPNKVRVDRATTDGQSWSWHEFKMTAYHFPGQTLYHAGLLVEGQGVRMLFVGDSFTPSGIDDYCAQNRTWLGRGVGFDRCIALIEELKPTHIFNCHVDQAFEFTSDQCRFMRENLARREVSFGRLVPWDHANYGVDDSWVRCHPYEQQARPGESVRLDVVVTNHSTQPQAVACRAARPRAWREIPAVEGRTDWVRSKIPAKAEGKVSILLRVPAGAPAGRHVIPVDIHYGSRVLPQFREAIIVL